MLNSNRLTVGISGLPGSGKSTAACSLAIALHGHVAAFGDYIRYIAHERGVSTERQTLQAIGESEVRADALKFVNGFLNWAAPLPDQPFIIDGVRHLSVEAALRSWSLRVGRSYVRVHIVTSNLLRASRRTNGDESALASIDEHPVEREAAMGLLANADLVFRDQDEVSLTQAVLDFATRKSCAAGR